MGQTRGAFGGVESGSVSPGRGGDIAQDASRRGAGPSGPTRPNLDAPWVYVRSARNHGREGFELFRRVFFPAFLPQIITSLRLALGIAWMVIVAAERCRPT